MKNILVIGANSYIGKQFYSYINNYKNDILKIDMVSASNGEWKLIEFNSYDSIILLSAIVHKNEKKVSKELYFEINHRMAVEIAKKAKESRVSQFIFMSTAAVFGSHRTRITNDTSPEPNTYYGMSKLAAENDIMKLQTNDFRVAIVRPPMVYGDDCKGNYDRLTKLAKFTFIFPDIHNKRSIIHITQLIEGLLFIIEESKSGIFHPQSKYYADTSLIVQNIRKKMGKKTLMIKFANPLLQALSSKSPTLKKLFTDYYYDKDITFFE